MFIEVIRAPEQATFLEILARYDFNKEQKSVLQLARRLDVVASRLQHDVFELGEFSGAAAARLNEVADLLGQMERSQGGMQNKSVDPLMQRFAVLLQSLAAKDGPVKAALGTLSPTELVAVEARVLRAAQKRARDEIEQRFEHARTELNMVRAHLVRLYQKLEAPARDNWQHKLTPQAARLVA